MDARRCTHAVDSSLYLIHFLSLPLKRKGCCGYGFRISHNHKQNCTVARLKSVEEGERRSGETGSYGYVFCGFLVVACLVRFLFQRTSQVIAWRGGLGEVVYAKQEETVSEVVRAPAMAAATAFSGCVHGGCRATEFFSGSSSSSLASQCGASSSQPRSRSVSVQCKPYVCRAATGEGSEASEASGAREPLLLRVARGEEAERTPVWLMRQAGRYMADFRKFSDKLSFRERSETADIAIELSLQPWLAFQTDGVIMFSDILTPLPALGIEFNMVKGKGPVISSPVRTLEDVKHLKTLDDPDQSLPFISEILSSLRKEVDGKATLIGFVGTPWTLAAYAMEGMSDKSLVKTKSIMLHNPEILHAFLRRLTDMLVTYVCHQIDSGAQIVQLFDSWAHHLSPEQFREFSWPYAEELVERVKSARPNVPLIFHANGGTGKLHIVAQRAHQDVVVGLDWATEMREARSQLGATAVLQGNVDPMVLFGPEDVIRRAVEQNIRDAGGKHHILNVGHGVIQGTPEDNVKFFCQLARESSRTGSSSLHEIRSAELLQV